MNLRGVPAGSNIRLPSASPKKLALATPRLVYRDPLAVRGATCVPGLDQACEGGDGGTRYSTPPGLRRIRQLTTAAVASRYLRFTSWSGCSG